MYKIDVTSLKCQLYLLFSKEAVCRYAELRSKEVYFSVWLWNWPDLSTFAELRENFYRS